MQLVLTPGEVTRSFDELFAGRETREEIARWASMLMHGFDDGSVRFEPASAEQRIKRALIFLSAVDMKLDEKTYLHSLEECREKSRELLL